VKKILFLDFDGVLHPDGIALFSKIGLLEEYLLQMPGIEIVISSTWRETQTLDELKNHFSEAVRDKIIGVTPSLEDGYDCGGRQREIHAFLDSAGMNDESTSWVALDDMPLFFDEGYPHLILTDSSQGFSEDNGDSLLAWYTNSAA
jgi:hypothetical protein